MTAANEHIGRGRPVTGAERDRIGADLKRRYEGGASIRELVVATGRSYGFVHRILGEYGAALRRKGAPQPPAAP